MIANCFISEGYPLYKVVPMCGLSKSSYYYTPKTGKRGRKPSTITMSKKGILYSNKYVVDRIKWLLNQEFVDYGYEKVTDWLKSNEDLVIDDKKVNRLMKESKLLNSRIKRNRRGKIIAKDLIPCPEHPFEHMQTDIKYIYIHGSHRNALLISVLDIFSRGILGYRLEWSITKHLVIDLMKEVLYHYHMPEKVTIRTDNGAQFEAGLFREYLSEMQIKHEFTHIATPQENCFIEAFHSIVENTVCRRYEFESLEEAKAVFNRFMNFYNQRRLHGALNNHSPNNFLRNLQKPIQLRIFNCFENLAYFEPKLIDRKVEFLSYY
jgi:transposase InsO family protein